MQLHLFSTAGEPSLRNIVDASRPFLQGQSNPTVAYLPAASIGELYVGLTKVAFKGLASVGHIDVERDKRERIEGILDKASMLYIPGGNTYLLGHRLHTKGLIETIRQRVLDGLPLIAFSAGTVLCGDNILTTNDINCCSCTTFAGLGLVPYNINVHYPSDEGDLQEARDERMTEYQAFHDNPILALEDGAHIRVTGSTIEVVKGKCWLFEKDRPTVNVSVGVLSNSARAL